MYRIAIGDDDPEALEELNGIVSRCLEAEGLRSGADYAVDCYSSASPLLARLEADGGYYRLVLLDIELGGENGLQVAAAAWEGDKPFKRGDETGIAKT